MRVVSHMLGLELQLGVRGCARIRARARDELGFEAELGHVLFVIVEVTPVLYEEVHAVLHALAVLLRLLFVELADHLDRAVRSIPWLKLTALLRRLCC